jgi:hypothetical protein
MLVCRKHLHMNTDIPKNYVVNQIDWQRLANSLIQQNRTLVNKETVLPYIFQLTKIAEMCGEYTSKRSTLSRIGTLLIKQKHQLIIPVCPDYTHENGLYTMKDLSDGVSLVAVKHFEFVEKIKLIIPQLRILVLIADHEADDNLLCRAMKTTREEFLLRINASKEKIVGLGYECQLMTDCIPNLVSQEQEMITQVTTNETFQRQIDYDTSKRSTLYDKIDSSTSWQERRMRTIKTAAQYSVLGTFCKENDWMVCNHTTTNLSWYEKVEAAIVHNPVKIY